MSSVLLSAKDLKLAYGNQILLDGVSLTVAPGEKVGLVGRNGCGKTSLFKILAKDSEPDSGEISLRRGVRIGYLPQEFELDGTMSVLENIEAGAADLVGWMRRYEAGEGSDAELSDLLELIQHADGWNLQTRIRAEAGSLAAPPLDALVGPLSGGEKRRVALCRALASQPDLLLLDEPTNHLDSETIRWLEDFLREFPGALIFVTHDRYFLETIATRIIEISDGRAFSHPGNYTAFLEAKALRRQIAEQSERRRQRFLRAELEYVRAGVRAQRSKSKHRLDSFYQIAGMEAPPEEREMDLLIPPAPEIGNTAVELAGAGARAGGTGRWLFRNMNLSLRAGQCTGVVGRNGVGKTTLLRVCLGELEPSEGTATVGKRVVFNYIDQSRMQLEGKGTVMDEVSDSGEMVAFGNQTLTARAYLRRFLFDESRVKERVDKLSGGERARLLLAKVLRRGGNVIILDEPTNDLDLASLRMLEEALADFDGTVLVVSHDRYFLDRICDQIVAFEEGGVFVQPGNFSYYLEKKKERAKSAQSSLKAFSSSPQPLPKSAPKAKRLNYKEQQELDSMEDTILATESTVREMESTLNDPAFFVSRAAEAPDLVKKLAATKSEVARLYERWEELAKRI
ncbi:MAG: ABC-F family ATP-binding cassette domain-containing protein [Terrimicrobiaceae bacterium]|nr:ABC-F family ATP-binding cassette domain-containing protein [Terrimicrobiaceae bacterium]